MKNKHNLVLILFPLVFGLIAYILISLISRHSSSLLSVHFSEHWELVYWTASLVFATIFLGIVAALQDHIRGWLYSPKLKCDLSLELPHSHLFKARRTYYIRFRIHNIGKVSAKNVEVMIKNVKNIRSEIIGLSTDNLKWSTEIVESVGYHKESNDNITRIVPINVQLPRMYWNYISPGTYQYCNLGDITDPEFDLSYKNFRLKELQDNDKLMFCFSVFWQTEDRKYAVVPGIYSFEIIVGSENAEVVKMFYKIEIGEKWYNNEFEMFNESFRILEEKQMK